MSEKQPEPAGNKKPFNWVIPISMLLLAGLGAGAFMVKRKPEQESDDLETQQEPKKPSREIADDERRRVMREMAAKGGKKRAENIKKRKAEKEAETLSDDSAAISA